MEPSDIWARAFDAVRRDLPVPTVWLAMQAAKPLTIDGSFFVAALPPQDEYLESHLQDNQAATAIEDALLAVTGRVLAFRLIIGTSLADWEAEKSRDAGGGPRAVPAEPPPAFFRSESTPPPPSQATPPAPQQPARAAAVPSGRAVSPTWEKLSERLTQGYKAAPFIKYPHGQAQYILACVKSISDTMDVLMPPLGTPRDDTQERLLAKMIERLGGVVNLDPLFLSLELLRYRESQGKSADVGI